MVKRQCILQRRIDHLIQVWLGIIVRMERYEITMAKRLAATRNATHAKLDCERWAQHRLDTLCAMKNQLFDLWFDTVIPEPSAGIVCSSLSSPIS